MKGPLSAFAIILTLLGKSQQNEILEVDMEFSNDLLVSLSTHIISTVPTPTQQINPTIQMTLSTVSSNNVNGFTFIPLVTLVPTQQTTTHVVNLTSTILQTVKLIIPEPERNKNSDSDATSSKIKKLKKTTESINIASVKPTVQVRVNEERETDSDINEIWNFLESKNEPKKKRENSCQVSGIKAKEAKKNLNVRKKKEATKIYEIVTKTDPKIINAVADSKSDEDLRRKTQLLEEKLSKLEQLLQDQKSETEKKKYVVQKSRRHKQQKGDSAVADTKFKKMTVDNHNLIAKVEHIDEVIPKESLQVLSHKNKHKQLQRKRRQPAKKKKDSCLIEQTVVIPASKISVPTLLPPALSNIAQKIGPTQTNISGKIVYNCITNYAGTATKTVTSMTVVPIPTTSLSVKTETVYAVKTQLLTEVLYTPYTVTTTSTDKMYMVKVTTVNGAGCKNCELDSNGMVLPAGQLPPGIFATPLNEVDPNKYDIIGYAGMNPPNFNPQLQGFQPVIPQMNFR